MRGGLLADQSARPQQGRRVRQQANDPTELQTVDKIVGQAELVLIERLSGFNPWSALIKKPLGHPAAGWNRAIKNLMFAGRMGELFWTSAWLPTPGAKRFLIQDAKPVKLVAWFQAKPV
jgi:hypothetical protein